MPPVIVFVIACTACLIGLGTGFLWAWLTDQQRQYREGYFDGYRHGVADAQGEAPSTPDAA